MKHKNQAAQTVQAETAPATTTRNTLVVEYARTLLASGSQEEALTVLKRVPDGMIAEVALQATQLREEATKQIEEEKAREESLKALASQFAPVQTTATKSDLAAHVKALWGDAPTQSEFLSSVLMNMGYDLPKAKATHNAVLTSEVAATLAAAYPQGLPASVTKAKTTWLADATTRQRLANHISKPPKFFIDGRC